MSEETQYCLYTYNLTIIERFILVLCIIFIKGIAKVAPKMKMDYKVSCNGSCGTVFIHLSAIHGDPDFKAG